MTRATTCAVDINIAEIGLYYGDCDLVDVASDDEGVTAAAVQQFNDADNGHVQVLLCVMWFIYNVTF